MTCQGLEPQTQRLRDETILGTHREVSPEDTEALVEMLGLFEQLAAAARDALASHGVPQGQTTP